LGISHHHHGGGDGAKCGAKLANTGCAVVCKATEACTAIYEAVFVVADINTESSKARKARQFSIRIVSESAFFDLIKN